MASSRRTDVVVTTIFEPAWLQGYLDNFRDHGREATVTLRIVCDRKTPPSVHAAAAAARRAGFKVDCPSLDEQQAYLRKLSLPDDFVPWDSDNRRNIGFLRAWQDGADVIVSIDDDNYCRPDSDFVAAHGVVGKTLAEAPGARLADDARWFNLCDLLTFDAEAPVFPRGYPYFARAPGQRANLRESAPTGSTLVAINAGLWLDEPDVDAVTRLALAPKATAAAPGSVVLGPDTWCPVNSQNTALMRAALPAYYYVRMGASVQGLRIDRFGDIFSGYFAQKCARHLGHAVRIGAPVADHRRTARDLLKDLYSEMAGIVLIEELLPWLRDVKLSGTTYHEAYASLAEGLAQQAPRFRGPVWDAGGREFLADTARCMTTWLAALP